MCSAIAQSSICRVFSSMLAIRYCYVVTAVSFDGVGNRGKWSEISAICACIYSTEISNKMSSASGALFH